MDGFGLQKGTDNGNGNVNNLQGIVGPKGTEKGPDYYQRDVFELDENMFRAGPYFNVQAVREGRAEEEIVVGTAQHSKRKEADFTLTGDNRIMQAKMRFRMDRGMVISCSFDPGNLFCTGCKARGPHSVVGSEDSDPVCLVFTDQNFPAVLFSQDERPCIGVVRVEGGTIKEIGFVIGDMLDGITVPKGSAILVGSVSDLGRQGLVGYADELTRTLRIVKDKLGKEVQMAAIPPVLLGGVNSYRLLRNIVEAEQWAENLIGGGGVLLKGMREEVKSQIVVMGVGKVKRPEENVHTLPKAVEAYEKIRMRVVGWPGMPARAAPLSPEGEGRIMERLVEDLRRNFGVRVSENLCMDRSVAVQTSATVYRMLGGSHCDRLGDTLAAMGKTVVKLTQSGWRPTRQNVENMVEKLGGEVSKEEVIVLFGLDNGTFYEEDEEDGTRRLPRRDEKGQYHVVGKLVVAAPRQVVGQLKGCREVTDLVSENRKVLFGPGPRYLRTKCCGGQGHCTNFCDAGYRKEMLCDLQDAKEAIVDMCRETGMRSFKVTNPVELMGIRFTTEEGELERLLGDDPVHYAGEGYATMARNLIEMVEGPRSVFQAEKREMEQVEEEIGLPDGEDMGSWRRGHTEWLFNTVSGLGGWKSKRSREQRGRGRGGRGRGGARGSRDLGPMDGEMGQGDWTAY
jgi:hypothetical protein